VSAIYAAVRATADPLEAHAQWCTARNDLLASHPESPVPLGERARFRAATTAPYDRSLRFEARLDTSGPPARLDVATGTDGVVTLERVGRLRLDDVGTLDVWWLAQYGGGIFLPIRDALANDTTYGGGRYILDTAKGADLGGCDDRLVVDLNFAYNPSCAYDPAWSCPLAPAGNVVDVPVYAGELMTEAPAS
jgi:uncharacterized protein (DUF1684 family)